MKKVFAAAIAAILALSLCACSGSDSNSSDETTEAVTQANSDVSKVEATTEEPAEETTEAATEARQVSDYVYTKIEKSLPSPGSFLLTGETNSAGENVPVRMPQLSINSADAQRVNSEINENCASAIDDLVQAAPIHPSGRIDYDCYLNGDVLSLVIENRSADTPNSVFYVYNFDVTTGNELSYGDVISRSDKSSEEVSEMIKSEINAVFDKMLNSSGGKLSDQVEAVRTSSLSDENLAKVMYYFNKEGQLAAAFRHYAIAGAESYGALCVFNAKIK